MTSFNLSYAVLCCLNRKADLHAGIELHIVSHATVAMPGGP
jgi:hypothetical protein